MDAAERIAAFATAIRYEDLPDLVVERTKQFLLDTLGVMAAGSNADGVAAVHAEVAGWGGRPEATVAVMGDKLPAPATALLNSMMVHGFEMDDTHDLAGLHANVTVVPAALAAAERAGGVDGRQLIAAVAVGVELAGRIGLSLRHYQGWHLTTVAGYFAAAAAAGRLLGLSTAQVVDALGIALSMAGGSHQQARDGSLTKRLQPGFSSQGGLTAALLARRGITGAANAFDGPFGFFKLFDGYHPDSTLVRTATDYGAHQLTGGLGERWEVTRLSAKPYPCCRQNHASIDAVRRLRESHNLQVDDVERVEVRVSQYTLNLVGQPFRRGPHTQAQAQFSLPYAIATTLQNGEVTIADYLADAIADPARQALAERVHPVLDPAIPNKLPVHLTVFTRAGVSHSITLNSIKGEPGTMDWQDFTDKYRGCIRHAARSLPRAGDLPQQIRDLEKVADVTDLLSALVG